jgi:CheY-like chemotaxis protein
MILIADTDLVTAGVVTYYLLWEGYEVRTVKSGTELLEEAIESLPELIIMDILLPDMNGLEITRTLKANEKNDTYSYTYPQFFGCTR